MTTTHDALVARYGLPARRPDRIPGKVLVFAHATAEAADAFADSNNAGGRCPTSVEFFEDGTWWTVVDLRPELDRIAARFKENSP